MLSVTNFYGMSLDDIKGKVRQSTDIREYERWLCISYCMQGFSSPEISKLLFRSEKTIREWINHFNSQGNGKVLQDQEKKISKEQIVDLKKDFESTPYELGYEKGYWTTTLIQEHIYQETGILYSKSRLSELMREWGFSVKRPRMKSQKADIDEQEAFVESFQQVIVFLFIVSQVTGIKLKILFTDEASLRRDGTVGIKKESAL